MKIFESAKLQLISEDLETNKKRTLTLNNLDLEATTEDILAIKNTLDGLIIDNISQVISVERHIHQ
ncbi:DUF1659 domain-containing protein [Aerococcus suis]|uniref:DUF1659 domain-containing protein n=1 Tax=Aerococcus suis TaxID=371602 RepID=A0A1W1Z080_9LACT|nr:hypothetical protein [Aerococcus suis]MCI7240718.1 hypothetical protein [Aerococcus suis]MDD7758506.1 hypothetical protein [Aerococcus suis]MDY4646207.1 hypothetical protein [Aerococcus suis]SMC41732.1 hypothetical protein SAMN04487984_1015 [Aerococcus suis]